MSFGNQINKPGENNSTPILFAPDTAAADAKEWPFFLFLFFVELSAGEMVKRPRWVYD